MKTHKFEPYFTGEPLVKVEYSYNDTHIFEQMGDVLLSAEITAEQLSHLNSLHSTEQIAAAYVFANAYGPKRDDDVRDRDYEPDFPDDDSDS